MRGGDCDLEDEKLTSRSEEEGVNGGKVESWDIEDVGLQNRCVVKEFPSLGGCAENEGRRVEN